MGEKKKKHFFFRLSLFNLQTKTINSVEIVFINKFSAYLKCRIFLCIKHDVKHCFMYF